MPMHVKGNAPKARNGLPFVRTPCLAQAREPGQAHDIKSELTHIHAQLRTTGYSATLACTQAWAGWAPGPARATKTVIDVAHCAARSGATETMLFNAVREHHTLAFLRDSIRECERPH